MGPKFILTMTLLLTVFTVLAQNRPQSQTYHLETRDGNTYIGQVVSKDSVKVLFKSDKLGEISLLHSDIIRMAPMDTDQMKQDHYWIENPQSTRYFFSPNGYGLKKGEGYYQNIWVLVNSFAIGVSNHVSLGAGVIPLFLFAGAPTPAWITAKVSVPVSKNRFNLGAGLMAGGVTGVSGGTFAILYGIATIGSKDVNLSLGAGYGMAGESGSGAPMINLNGMWRVGPRGYLLTENYYFSNGSSGSMMLSFGGRTIIREAGLDYGLFFPLVEGAGIVAVPWLGITIPIGKIK